jgi:6-phosphogluconolactonase
MSSQGSGTIVYIGTYTHRAARLPYASEGIYVFRMDHASGALTPVGVTTGVANPSFLAIDPQQRYLYAVNELMEFSAQPGGAVSAFAIDPTTGALRYLNQQPSHGTAPCHLSVDTTGRWVLAANYMGGNLSVFPILADGQLGPASDTVQHHGSSVNPERQEGPHAHAIIQDPAGRYALASDLGIDKVMIYRFDVERGRLQPNDEPWAQVRPGAGPRHLAFHPSGAYLYLIQELNSTLTVFAYDADRGALREIQTVSTLPAGFAGTNSCADIHVAPSGRFVYGSNRGHDTIAIFEVDQGAGRLTPLGHESTQGRTPRNFAIDPTGAFLLAANQDTDTVVTFRIDQRTGRLSTTGQVIDVPSPVCVKFGRAV